MAFFLFDKAEDVLLDRLRGHTYFAVLHLSFGTGEKPFQISSGRKKKLKKVAF